MFRNILICASTFAVLSSAAIATTPSPYSLACTGGGAVKFINPHVWNSGGIVIPAASSVEVIVAGAGKPVVTKLVVALKPGETFITGGIARPPYSCTARIL